MTQFSSLIENAGYFLSLILELTSVLCIGVGFISAILILLQSRRLHASPMHRRMKLKFGGWLALALEFQLASDIVKTTITPTYDNLIQLAAVAVIRTFLTYFLNRELKEDIEMLKNSPVEKEILEK